MAVEHRDHRALDQLVDDLLFLALFHGLELDLAAERRDDVGQVAHARHDFLLAASDRASQCVREQALVVSDRRPDRDARALVDVGASTGEPRDLHDDLFHVVRDRHGVVFVEELAALLVHDVDLVGGGLRVVRPDLRAEAVAQRCNDAAAVRVVFRVRARDQEHVQRQTHTVPADLHVALLHDIEEPNLNALGQVGQLVDAENAAVGARDETVVYRQLVAQVAAFGDFDRVHLSNQVGNRAIRRGELLAVALLPG